MNESITRIMLASCVACCLTFALGCSDDNPNIGGDVGSTDPADGATSMDTVDEAPDEEDGEGSNEDAASDDESDTSSNGGDTNVGEDGTDDPGDVALNDGESEPEDVASNDGGNGCGSGETFVEDACLMCGPAGGCADEGSACRSTCEANDDCDIGACDQDRGVCQRACF